MAAKKEKRDKPGQPPKFEDVDTLKRLIDEYFDYCDNRIQQVYSPKSESVIEIIDPAPYTMAGLAYYLGMDRRSLLNYSKREQFFPTIKAARDRVEADVEERMNDKTKFTAGLIFNAKNNFGWVDKTETDVTTKGKEVNAYSALTTEELRKLAGK